MYLVILKGMPYDMLNHVHDVGSKTTALEGPLSNTPNLTPDEVEYTKGSCIWCHPVEQVLGIVCNVSLISTLAVNCLSEYPV